MTNPVSQGQPDWARLEPWSDQPIIYDPTASFANSKSYPITYVGNLSALLFILQAATQDWELHLNWSLNNDGTSPQGTDILNGFAAQSLRHSFIPRGPYLQIDAMRSGVGNIAMNLQVMSQNGAQRPTFSPGDLVLLDLVGQPVGAGANDIQIFRANFIGEATLRFATPLAGWSYNVQITDSTGAVFRADRSTGAAAAEVIRRIHLPGGKQRIQVSNTTVGAGTYDIQIVGSPVN